MNRRVIANRLALLYPLRSLQGYARWKVRMDPAYDAVLQRLRGDARPLLDLGCGIGLLPFYLREHGYDAPIIGIDFDERKIELARRAAMRYRGIDFVTADARDPLPDGRNVVLLDLLQYFDASAQQQILANVAGAAAPGGVVILRQGICDRSWRYRLTAAVDALGRASRWMKAEGLRFPTREEVTGPFAGFEQEVAPLRGATPYNNYLFVFRKASSAGTTNP